MGIMLSEVKTKPLDKYAILIILIGIMLSEVETKPLDKYTILIIGS